MNSQAKVIANLEVKRFAQEQAAHRLAKIVFEVKRFVQLAPGSEDSVDAIHDFRVATRRFRAVLDTFPDFFPKADRKKVRKVVRMMFSLAGEVRNRDIAMELIRESAAGMPAEVITSLNEERSEFERRVRDELRTWVRRDFSARWREQLNLP